MKGVKKAAIIALVAITVAACTMKKQAESEVSQAQLLDERLTTLQQKGYMSGHQDLLPTTTVENTISYMVMSSIQLFLKATK